MRLGREWCACAFLAVSRYRADVIRKKQREKSPFEMNGNTPKNAENVVLLWSYITLAYCYLATRFYRQTVDAALDFVVVRTEFEYVTRFVRYRSSKCVWSQQKSQIRVSHDQRTRKLEWRRSVRTMWKSSEQIVVTAKIFALQAWFFHHFVATLVLFHPMSLPKHRPIPHVNYSPQSDRSTVKRSHSLQC